MLTRVVRLSFRPEAVAIFQQTLKSFEASIRESPGCLDLQIYRDKEDLHVFYTISRWQEASDLEAYRKSDLFGKVWKSVKPGFRSPALAWSLEEIQDINKG
ncbi:MAG: antibiotic biosynthesis monooxygenase [Sphingobacteriales bacterium]|jgi:quinol monooxygenase YgiN|nr:antibiotic biosynthesis monooxygenase [Sphingobacteriales bacterium]